MGKLQFFDILLDQPQAVYQAGQMITGNVVVEMNAEMKVREVRLKLCGEANVHWSERHSTGSGKNRRTTTRHYSSHETYFNHVVAVFAKGPGQSGSDLMHPAGRHVYPFQFQLPVNIPSSFEGAFGRVRYSIKGTIDKPWKFDHNCKRAFTVLSILDLNMQPDASAPQQGQNSKTLCCLCCKSGPISAVLRIDRKGYVPGEFVTLSGEVDNKSNRKMTSSSAQLKMYTTFRATTKARTVSCTVTEVKKGEIPPGGSEEWNRETLHIPPLPPSSLIYCNIIDIRYVLDLNVDPAGPALDLDVPLEICVGTVPLRSFSSVYSASPFSAPNAYMDMTGDQTVAPIMPTAPPMPVDVHHGASGQPYAPPPSYAECVFGKVNISEENDNEYTHGNKEWSPSYTYYTWADPNQPQPQPQPM